MTHTVELLAPAGSREAFLGALSAGADAVYLAGQKFGARAYAGNFTEEELTESLREAHLLGRKIYLTVNTLTREEELPELTDFVARMYEHGLDGVIVQDLGVISALRKRCPGLLLHASTQLSVTGAESVRLLKELGVCRVVPARELSLKEMKQLKEEGGIEVEAFIHGAMCYCYSGRCLMSGFLGGRSGNRGRCAGTCRLPYRVLDPQERPAGTDAGKKEYYPISMKDMSVLDILPDLMDAGIDSFKIEGRMKKPEYAAGVTSVYRRYIDYFYKWDREGRKSPWKVKKEDREWLTSLYIRTEIGTGYYHQDKGRDMLTIGLPGYAGADPDILEEVRKKYLSGLPRLSVKGRAFLYQGQEAVLEVEYGGIRASARGIPVSAA
ncbi:MAG: U32 family peptidase, partial [Lachnospiraceae bacterium]|nr:U32 family peptidase [Lachnospiraceae bacterium]